MKPTPSTTIFELKDYFLTGESFEIQMSSINGILETTPQPQDLDKYYKSEDYLSHDDSNRSFFAQCYNVVKRFNLKSKANLIRPYIKTGQVLDIGAGVGDLVSQLKKENVNVVGFEPSAIARKNALHKGMHLENNLDVFANKKFDVILMYHVLEHVTNLQEYISWLYEHLHDNGRIIIALPNYESYDARHFKKFWAGYDVPRHLYHFNKKGLQNLVSDKFKIEKTIPMWWDSFYVSILSARYQKKPLAFLYGVFIGLVSNFRVFFTGEASSLQYILKKRS